MTQTLAVSKQGYDALIETNPNNFIFHSSYNSFKIVYQEKTTVTTIAGSHNYSFAHNSPLANPSCILIFAQFPDGKSTLLNAGLQTLSYNGSHSINGGVYFDSTNIYFTDNNVVTPYNIVFVWYIFEAGL